MLSILWFAFWLALAQGRGAPPSSAPADRGSIEGKVIRAAALGAGIPAVLPDARVEITPAVNQAMGTRVDGTFKFLNLPPGKYTITVSRDGFVPQEDRAHGITPGGLHITLLPGQALKDIVLPMVAAPALIGKVVDPHGAPLAAALVRAYAREYTPYGPELNMARKGMTNDLGEFRLAGLTWGNYFVSAGYSDRDRAIAVGPARLSANVAKADAGYTTVFYDGADDIGHAQAARLAPGVDAGILNIYLSNANRYKIRGQTVPLIGGASIMVAPYGSDLRNPDITTQTSTAGLFEVSGLSPGTYEMVAMTNGGMGVSDVVAVNITDRDIEGVRLALHLTVNVSGTVALEDASRVSGISPADLRVRLTRAGVQFDQPVAARVAADGSFTLEHLSPTAEYDIAVDNLPPGYYVKSISSNGRNLLGGGAPAPGQPLRISAGPATDDLSVHVTGAGDAVGAEVVLVPNVPLRRRVDRYFTGFTDQNGELQLTGLAPGDYTAYAFEQIERGAYYALAYNPSAENRFRERAVPVTVGGSGGKSIQLRLISAGETIGAFQ